MKAMGSGNYRTQCITALLLPLLLAVLFASFR